MKKVPIQAALNPPDSQIKTKQNETSYNIDLQLPESPLDRCLPALANSNLIPRVKILVHEVISI